MAIIFSPGQPQTSPSLRTSTPPTFTTATLGYHSFSRDGVSSLPNILFSSPESFYPSPTLSSPSLDPSHNQSQYWGGGSSTGASSAGTSPTAAVSSSAYSTPTSLYSQTTATSRALPTPPNTNSDSELTKQYQFGVPREDLSSVTASLTPSYSMNNTSDPTSGAPMSSSIAARRHHSSLPSFQLPNNRGGYSSLGSVLTPPTGHSADTGNSMTSTMGANTSTSITAAPGSYSSSPNYWSAPPPNSSYSTYGSTQATSPSFTSSPGLTSASNIGYRNMYTPGGSTVNRNNSRPSSPSTNNLVGSQAYEPSSQYAASTGLPSMGQQHYAGYSVSSGPSPSSMNSQSQPTHDLYSSHSSLPPPNPSHSYYSHSSTFGSSSSGPQILSMSSAQPTSTLNRGLLSAASTPTPPYPHAHPHHPPLHPAPPHLGLRYTLGHMGSMPVHYSGIMGMHPNMQQQERPFKCDVCPQSFNRNHDLKRHKRIHLAVKPFPCDNCEKSFSRKDALKVRRTGSQIWKYY